LKNHHSSVLLYNAFLVKALRSSILTAFYSLNPDP